MIKTIMKEIGIDAGSLELVIMHKLVILDQTSLLNENATIFETIDDIAVGMLELK
jgi:ATP-binding cassette subfamily F protein 3